MTKHMSKMSYEEFYTEVPKMIKRIHKRVAITVENKRRFDDGEITAVEYLKTLTVNID